MNETQTEKKPRYAIRPYDPAKLAEINRLRQIRGLKPLTNEVRMREVQAISNTSQPDKR